MSDKRKNNGGHSTKGFAGRPSKAEEDKLLTKLSNLDYKAFKCLEKGIKDGNYNFWNKFMEYRWGKPKEKVDITTNGDNFNFPIISFFKTKDDKED